MYEWRGDCINDMARDDRRARNSGNFVFIFIFSTIEDEIAHYEEIVPVEIDNDEPPKSKRVVNLLWNFIGR